MGDIMKRIYLTQGFFTIVDDEDYDYLIKYKWDVQRSKKKSVCYARTRINDSTGKRITLLMHRIIMKAPINLQVDHISGNGLNNLRGNLRLCTQTQNNGNTRIYRHNTSGIKGVSWNKSRKKWIAQIYKKNKPVYLGGFDCPLIAKLVYEKEAKEYFGEFASTIKNDKIYDIIPKKKFPGGNRKSYNIGLCNEVNCMRQANSLGFCKSHYKKNILRPRIKKLKLANTR
jgi:hypothetical protein